MSALSRFMSTARQVLDEQDRKASKAQPPFFVRTTWLFTELELLVLPGEHAAFKEMQIARLHGDIAQAERLVAQVLATTEAMPAGRERHERQQLCGWINEQIERERT